MEEKNESSSQSKNNPKENNSRRTFLKVAGVAAGAVAVGATLSSVPLLKEVQAATTPKAGTTAIVPLAFYQSSGLLKFDQPMRGVYPLDPNGIPVAIPDETTGVGGAKHYKIDVQDYFDRLHPSFEPGSTHLRGYHPVNALTMGSPPPTQKHLGGIIIANKGEPTQITFTNKLSGTHPIPIDRSIMGATEGDNRTAVHLHGGFVPYISDGGPYSWFDSQTDPNVSGFHYGLSVPQEYYKVLNNNIVNGQAEYYYPNEQSARMVWYHDHTLGITRMNAYIGIASAYIIRDTFEAGLRSQGLPDYIENLGNEIPIVIQDKTFVDANTIAAADPTWTGPTKSGSLWYAHTYDPKRWKQLGRSKTLLDPSVIPEFFGDTMLANGTVYPEATVQARRYRLRILNACQARFLNLQLYVDDGSADSITLTPGTNVPTNLPGPSFLVLGTEGGFLPKPVNVPSNGPFNPLTFGGSLITAPAERWDVIVDFTEFAGKKVVLYNDAPAPFPMGDPRYDYFPMAPNNPTITTPGSGPNTRQIMRFNVIPATGAGDPPLNITTATDLTEGNDELPVALGTLTLPANIPVRRLTLNEDFDLNGRLIQMLGTDIAPIKASKGFGRAYSDLSTENVTLVDGKKDEIWQILNLTGDTHPIHFHLVNVQIISRQAFNVSNYGGGVPALKGLARSPDLYEQGWKETVRMNPGEVTNVYVPFRLPTMPTEISSLSSPRTGGYEYVWHCHILEHEEHDMMRPLVVTP